MAHKDISEGVDGVIVFFNWRVADPCKGTPSSPPAAGLKMWHTSVPKPNDWNDLENFLYVDESKKLITKDKMLINICSDIGKAGDYLFTTY